MREFYLDQKKNNKIFINFYHVSGFFQFLMVIVSIDVSKLVTIE